MAALPMVCQAACFSASEAAFPFKYLRNDLRDLRKKINLCVDKSILELRSTEKSVRKLLRKYYTRNEWESIHNIL